MPRDEAQTGLRTNRTACLVSIFLYGESLEERPELDARSHFGRLKPSVCYISLSAQAALSCFAGKS